MAFCTFSKEFDNAYTIVENKFITKYLPQADGFAAGYAAFYTAHHGADPAGYHGASHHGTADDPSAYHPAGYHGAACHGIGGSESSETGGKSVYHHRDGDYGHLSGGNGPCPMGQR